MCACTCVCLQPGESVSPHLYRMQDTITFSIDLHQLSEGKPCPVECVSATSPVRDSTFVFLSFSYLLSSYIAGEPALLSPASLNLVGLVQATASSSTTVPKELVEFLRLYDTKKHNGPETLFRRARRRRRHQTRATLLCFSARPRVQ